MEHRCNISTRVKLSHLLQQDTSFLVLSSGDVIGGRQNGGGRVFGVLRYFSSSLFFMSYLAVLGRVPGFVKCNCTPHLPRPPASQTRMTTIISASERYLMHDWGGIAASLGRNSVVHRVDDISIFGLSEQVSNRSVLVWFHRRYQWDHRNVVDWRHQTQTS